jgi:hypothetical protein
VGHYLAVSRGYPQRYKALRKAQHDHAKAKEFASALEVSPTTTDAERKEARRAVIAAMTRLVNRCHKEGLID